MGRIPLLPLWVMPSMPAIYESESYTATEMVAAAYGKMRELVADYNEFAESVNKEITNFHGATETEIANFKEYVEQRLCCKFQELDRVAKLQWLDVKKYADEAVAKTFSEIDVTDVVGEKINNAIRSGTISVAVEYDPETESVNIITGGEV